MTRCRDLGQLDLNSVVRVAQGVTALAANGQATLDNPLAASIKSVSFYSRLTPVRTYTGQQLNDIYRDPTPNPYLKLIQPVVTLDTVFGTQTIAPYGKPHPEEWKKNVTEIGIAVAGGVVIGLGVAFLAGLAVGRARFA